MGVVSRDGGGKPVRRNPFLPCVPQHRNPVKKMVGPILGAGAFHAMLEPFPGRVSRDGGVGSPVGKSPFSPSGR